MMAKRLKNVIFASTAFLSVAFGAATASADYLCSVGYYPGNSTIWGTEGSIYFEVYTSANCGGSFVKSYALCSTDATSTSCAAGRANDRQTLLANLQAMQQAAAADQKITVVTASCIGGATGCAHYLKFYSN